jgi:hypothetical protein
MFVDDEDEECFDGGLPDKRVSVDPPSSGESPCEPLPPPARAILVPPHGEEIPHVQSLPPPAGAIIHPHGGLPLQVRPHEEITIASVPMPPPPLSIIPRKGGLPLLVRAAGTSAAKSIEPTSKQLPKKKSFSVSVKGKYKEIRQKEERKVGKKDD